MGTEYEICIIGGGPAGSVLGARLAQFGFSVCLVERATFPRRRLGESLTPGVLPLLEAIGAGPAIVAAAFPRVRRVSVHWEDCREREEPDGRGMLVDRGHFDRLLLDHARNCGVDVRQPAAVRWPRDAGDAWELEVATGAEDERCATPLRARFLADASGRSGVLPRCRRWTGPRTVAVHGYWSGGGLPEHPRIEAGPHGWFWGVPLPDGVYNTLAFVDPRDLKAMGGGLESKFQRLIRATSLIPPGAEAKRDGRARAMDATPFLDEACITDKSIKVGDAAMALDPLSSSGVQASIQSAMVGAVVVNTVLRRPQSAKLAQQFYRDRLAERSVRHRAWASDQYSRADVAGKGGRFWQERVAPPVPVPVPAKPAVPRDVPLELAPQVAIRPVPCVVDRFIASRPAVTSPALESPVAYLGGLELAPLVCQARAGMTLQDLVRAWMPSVRPAEGAAIANWLVTRGLLVPVRDAPSDTAGSGA
jgi:flavin-dependent dehydrogenase